MGSQLSGGGGPQSQRALRSGRPSLPTQRWQRRLLAAEGHGRAADGLRAPGRRVEGAAGAANAAREADIGEEGEDGARHAGVVRGAGADRKASVEQHADGPLGADLTELAQ